MEQTGVSGTATPGTAELQLGSKHRGWYSRGYLPHCDHPGLLQTITYRLADSLPARVVAEFETDTRHLSPEERRNQRRARVDAWLDSGFGCCVLQYPAAAACVRDSWQHFARIYYDLIAWVIMPNHVHVLIRVYDGVPMSKIVQSWKNFTARRIRQMISEETLVSPLPEKGLWMRDYWDRFIRSEQHFQATVEYIHQNPVKAGLVSKGDDWPWSSSLAWGGLAGTD